MVTTPTSGPQQLSGGGAWSHSQNSVYFLSIRVVHFEPFGGAMARCSEMTLMKRSYTALPGSVFIEVLMALMAARLVASACSMVLPGDAQAFITASTRSKARCLPSLFRVCQYSRS